jgi:long-chain acyl-CoA synthetase
MTAWPDDVLARLTAKPGPFELIYPLDEQDAPLFAGGAQTLTDICARARRFGSRLWLVGQPDGSFEQIFSRADRLAAHLQLQGRRRVGLAATRPREWITGFLGCVLAGVTPVLFDPDLPPQSLIVFAKMTGIDTILVDDVVERSPVSCLQRKSICDLPPALPLSQSFAPALTDDAMIVATSGTTGKPKAMVFDQLGVVTGLRALLLNGALAAARDGPSEVAGRLPVQPCALITGPLFHISGFGPLLLALFTGAAVLVLPEWPGADLASVVESHRVATIGGLTPDQLHDVLSAPAASLKSLVSINVQGGAVSGAMLERLRSHISPARVTASYGLAESMGACAIAAARDLVRAPGTSGLVSPLMRVRILDQFGREASNGAPGEIHLKGRLLARSYCVGDEPLLRDGWFKTGDMGCIDAEGRLTVIGRRLDCAWLGGRLVSAQELEGLAMTDLRVRRTVCAYDPERAVFTLRFEANAWIDNEIYSDLVSMIPELDGRLETQRLGKLALTRTGKVSRRI